MKFQDIPVNIITVRIKRSDNVEALQEQPVFSVEASLSRADEFEIRLRDAVVFVRPVAAVDIRRLNAELASSVNYHIISIADYIMICTKCLYPKFSEIQYLLYLC